MKNNRGIILIASYMVIAVLLVLGGAFMSRSIAENRIAARERDSIQAFYIAEGGIEWGLAWLRAQPSPPGGTQVFYPHPLGEEPVALGKGFYTISIKPNENNPALFLNRYKIKSTGSLGDITQKVVLEVQVDSFARYAYFTNSERFHWRERWHPVWFISGDYLWGQTHSNSHFNIHGNPVFAGQVSTVADYNIYYQGGPPLDNPDFRQGIRFGVETIEIPADIANLEVLALNDGLLLEGNTIVELQSDGTMNVTNEDEGWDEQNMGLPANGVLYVKDGSLRISGTLKGRLTAGSEGNIWIAGNILYNTDPRSDPTSEDMLGLVSQNNVIVSRYAPFNVEINATIMALRGSFFVNDWDDGPLKGTLTVYGGIIQNNRGPVGRFNTRTSRRVRGFAKDYYHDSRLSIIPPPFFPTTGDYVVLSWKKE